MMFLMSKAQRVICNAVALIALLGIVVPITWLVFDRDSPTVLTSGVTVPSTVILGQNYRLKWQYKPTKRVCDGLVTWVVWPGPIGSCTLKFSRVPAWKAVFSASCPASLGRKIPPMASSPGA